MCIRDSSCPAPPCLPAAGKKPPYVRAPFPEAQTGGYIIGDGKYGINEVNKKFGCKTQCLCSYKLKFNFKTDAGILNYLKEKTVKLSFAQSEMH